MRARDKGANRAVALAQLGVRVALLGVLGDDHTADHLLTRAQADDVAVATELHPGTAGALSRRGTGRLIPLSQRG